ncbi:MAG: adenylate/guanylate cyclase domain-containing protein [Pseudomonadota bacterium]
MTTAIPVGPRTNPTLDTALTRRITDWLVDQSLGRPDIVQMFEGVCERIHASGTPLARAMLTYPTLHPVYDGEAVIWRRCQDTEFEQYVFNNDGDAWGTSPFAYMLNTPIDLLRRRLSGENRLIDFPVLQEFADNGLTDYLALTTGFSMPTGPYDEDNAGIIVSWASDRAGGFTDDDIAALIHIQRRFAVACKTSIQASIATNISDTYLGHRPRARVLSGKIRRGDGENIRSVVWYADIRGSTALADRMPMDDYLDLLNAFFECIAGAALDAGGEVLDFIGDAVLAIFPIDDQCDLTGAANAAIAAVYDALARAEASNAERISKGAAPFSFGIALNAGDVTFGNIGVPQRLAFTVVGPTVNEVVRVEKLTRVIDTMVLATPTIAALTPDHWADAGIHTLDGVGEPMQLSSWSPRTKGTAPDQ